MRYSFAGSKLEAVRLPATTIGESGSGSFSQANQTYIIGSTYSLNTIFTLSAQGNDVLLGATNTTNSFTGASMFRIGSAAGNFFDGTIGELIYYSSLLSSSDQNIVHCYLSQRYNVAVSPGYTCN